MADVNNLFNQQDKPLRKYKLAMVVDSFTTDNKAVLVASERLCEKYGITDVVFKNSLGSKVRFARATLKHFGNSRPRIKPLVDTVFFLTLLDFKKKTEIKNAKSHLRIDYSIANLIAEYTVFKRKHSKPNLDSSFLDDYEAKVLNKNESESEKKVGATVEA